MPAMPLRRPFKSRAVKGGDKVDLGGGHVIEFVMAPNLHWPDTMFSFDHATGAWVRAALRLPVELGRG